MGKMQMRNTFSTMDMKSGELNVNQYVREYVVNAREANATRCYFDVEWNGVENKGIHRQIIWDNGDGMNRNELRDFMGCMGDGNKEHGINKNFHVGARISSIAFNKEGVICLSMKDDELNVLWYHMSASGKEIEIKEFDANTVCDAFDVPEEIENECLKKYGFRIEDLANDLLTNLKRVKSKSGCAFLFLGNSPKQHTVKSFDPRHFKYEDREDVFFTRSGDFSRRFYKPLDAMEVHAIEYNHGEKWPTNRNDLKNAPDGKKANRGQYRKLDSLYHYLSNNRNKGATVFTMEDEGFVQHPDGTKIHYILRDGISLNEACAFNRGKGFVCLLNNNEMFAHDKTKPMFNRFGVWHKDVYEFVWIFVEPSVNMIYSNDTYMGWRQNETRSKFEFANAESGLCENQTDTQILKYGKYFSEHMPVSIANKLQAVTDRYANENEDKAEKAKHLYELYPSKSLEKKEVIVRDDNGELINSSVDTSDRSKGNTPDDTNLGGGNTSDGPSNSENGTASNTVYEPNEDDTANPVVRKKSEIIHLPHFIFNSSDVPLDNAIEASGTKTLFPNEVIVYENHVFIQEFYESVLNTPKVDEWVSGNSSRYMAVKKLMQQQIEEIIEHTIFSIRRNKNGIGLKDVSIDTVFDVFLSVKLAGMLFTKDGLMRKFMTLKNLAAQDSNHVCHSDFDRVEDVGI